MKAVKLLNLCMENYISTESCQTLSGYGSAALKDGSEVSLSHAPCSACVPVAAPWAVAALLPLMSLES